MKKALCCSIFFIFLLICSYVWANEKLPYDIVWLTNDSDPVYSSPLAKKGGVLHTALLTFPMTFRTVGPDSNFTFAGVLRDCCLGLIGIHPNTGNIIPEIATHWAFGKDGKTMYFKINPKARWSDGMPVTAADFEYTLEFMSSKYIAAPWYNEYYTKEIDKVIIYDDHTIAVVASSVKPDLYLKIAIHPTPKHFYGTLDKDFIQKYNWKPAPNTGAYQISDFKKGKYVEFERKKDWWGKDLVYFKNRFNIDKVVFKVIMDYSRQWEYFKKGYIDVFTLTLPEYWHVKSNIALAEKGYINKIQFFNDVPRSASGFWLNQAKEPFTDQRARYAFAHGMNISKVIKHVLRDDYFRLEHGYMGYGRYSDNSISARRFDLDRAASYMKDAGWTRGADSIWEKDGKRFSVTVTYGIDEHTPRLVVLKEEAKKAGIELLLDRQDPSAAYKKIIEKRHQIAWMGWTTSLRPQFWGQFHSVNADKPQTNNITNTKDPVLDSLIDQYRKAVDEKQRIKLALEIERKINEIGSFVPTFMVPYVRHAYWRWLKLPDFRGTKMSEDLFEPFNSATGGLFWFDESAHKETLEAQKEGKSFPISTVIDKTWFNAPQE